MTINFAWATLDQLEQVWELEGNSGTPWVHPQVYFEEALRYKRLLLAMEGDTAVAYLVYEIIWGNTPFLSLLKVLPDHQRKGIGKLAVKQLEKHLVSLNFKSYVTSSETINEKTKQFFPSLGFERIGELQMQHGGEIFYLKKLS